MSDSANTEQNNDGTQEPETGKAADETTEPTLEDLKAKVEELTGHSRKWEDRAKENFEARKELDALRLSQMTDDEKAKANVEGLEKRATDAEARADEAEAALARYQIAAEFELSKEDTEALAAVSDEATLRALAQRLADRSSGPRPNNSQGRTSGPVVRTPGQAFADAMSELDF